MVVLHLVDSSCDDFKRFMEKYDRLENVYYRGEMQLVDDGERGEVRVNPEINQW